MLEYEKRLHFDEHYKKLQDSHWLKRCFVLIYSLAVYLIIYYILRWTGIKIHDLFAWNQSQKIVQLGNISFLRIDILYLIGGLIMTCYSFIRLNAITVQNHTVRENGAPNRLLVDGYYSKLRHPMYGTFILMYSGTLLSTRSLFGLILWGILAGLQVVNTIAEEKRLNTQFKNEYDQYASHTKRMLLTNPQIFILAIAVMFTILGFVFNK